MRIIYFYNEEWEKAFVGERMPDQQFVFYRAPLENHPDLFDADAEVLSVFVKTRVDGAAMDRFPKLRLIATRSTGFDHIDIAEAARRGIAVVSVPAYGENTVAEFAFALILALSRKVRDASHRMYDEHLFSQQGLRGFDLMGKTLGVVGTGRIGQQGIRIARGFLMRVVACDPFPNQDIAGTLDFSYVSFEELLAESDIITLHTPYNEHTHHMIDESAIKKMKRGVYLINTARGGLVDTLALVRGLNEGVIGAAGLDVFEFEELLGEGIADALLPDGVASDRTRTLLGNHYLIEHPRVIVTPHNAFNTQEAVERILLTTIDNIRSFSQGAPKNTVGGSL
ncbi:MAG: NAD(P)-dependent oxidoreductase [Minisyncoccota bacterium]